MRRYLQAALHKLLPLPGLDCSRFQTPNLKAYPQADVWEPVQKLVRHKSNTTWLDHLAKTSVKEIALSWHLTP